MRWIGIVVVAAGVLGLWWSTRPASLHENVEPEPSVEPEEARPAAPSPVPAPAPRHPDAGAPLTPRAAPTSAASLAPGQALREVRALVDQQKIGAARALAEHYLNEIPDGEEAAQIKSLTGVHPHP